MNSTKPITEPMNDYPLTKQVDEPTNYIDNSTGSTVISDSHSGSSDSYRIEFGNGIVEIGGIKQIQANSVTTGIIEGIVTIPTQFSKILNAQATAMNVTEAPSALNGERAHIAIEGTTLKLYASANSNSSTTIPVSWTVKGVK